MDLTDPQQSNGYTYSNNNPVSLSDPTGLRPDGVCGGNSSWCRSDNVRNDVAQHHNESWQKTSSGWIWREYDESKSGKRWYRTACVGCRGQYYILPKRSLKWTDVVEAVGFVNPELSPITELALAINSYADGNNYESANHLINMLPGMKAA